MKPWEGSWGGGRQAGKEIVTMRWEDYNGFDLM
jgi:hypothetical protein